LTLWRIFLLKIKLLRKRGTNTAVELLRDNLDLRLTFNRRDTAEYVGLHASADNLFTLSLTRQRVDPIASQPICVALADLRDDLSIVVGEDGLIEGVAELRARAYGHQDRFEQVLHIVSYIFNSTGGNNFSVVEDSAVEPLLDAENEGAVLLSELDTSSSSERSVSAEDSGVGVGTTVSAVAGLGNGFSAPSLPAGVAPC
jgi:hypothetical protein